MGWIGWGSDKAKDSISLRAKKGDFMYENAKKTQRHMEKTGKTNIRASRQELKLFNFKFQKFENFEKL